MKKVCTLFCLVMVILCITNTTALAAEPEGKVIDLGDGFYAVETITCSPMTRSRDTTGGSVSNNVYYGSTLIGTATLYATFDISGSAAKVEEANISGTGKNGGAYSDGSKYTIIFHDDAPDMNRGFLNIMARDSNQLERAFIVADVQLELTSVVDSTISGILNVPEIMQLPEWQNGCWAAAAISAGQYLNPSVDLTITDVMEKYADGQDVAKSYLTVRDIIRDEYGQIPAAHLTDLRFTKVVEQIEEGEDNGKPIVARAAYDRLKSGHFVVVCGFDDVPSPGNCYVTVMDSLSGDYRVFPTSGWEGRTIVYYYSTSGNHAYPITIYLVMT